MFHLLRERATPDQIKEMLEEYEGMIKIVADIRPRLGNRNILIQSQELRDSVESVTSEILGGVL